MQGEKFPWKVSEIFTEERGRAGEMLVKDVLAGDSERDSSPTQLERGLYPSRPRKESGGKAQLISKRGEILLFYFEGKELREGDLLKRILST